MHKKITKTGLGYFGVRHSYAAAMSWKRPSDPQAQGTKFASLGLDFHGGLDLEASESPDSNRGTKEAHVDLSPEKTEELRRLLLGQLPSGYLAATAPCSKIKDAVWDLIHQAERSKTPELLARAARLRSELEGV